MKSLSSLSNTISDITRSTTSSILNFTANKVMKPNQKYYEKLKKKEVKNVIAEFTLSARHTISEILKDTSANISNNPLSETLLNIIFNNDKLIENIPAPEDGVDELVCATAKQTGRLEPFIRLGLQAIATPFVLMGFKESAHDLIETLIDKKNKTNKKNALHDLLPKIKDQDKKDTPIFKENDTYAQCMEKLQTHIKNNKLTQNDAVNILKYTDNLREEESLKKDYNALPSKVIAMGGMYAGMLTSIPWSMAECSHKITGLKNLKTVAHGLHHLSEGIFMGSQALMAAHGAWKVVSGASKLKTLNKENKEATQSPKEKLKELKKEHTNTKKLLQHAKTDVLEKNIKEIETQISKIETQISDIDDIYQAERRQIKVNDIGYGLGIAGSEIGMIYAAAAAPHLSLAFAGATILSTFIPKIASMTGYIEDDGHEHDDFEGKNLPSIVTSAAQQIASYIPYINLKPILEQKSDDDLQKMVGDENTEKDAEKYCTDDGCSHEYDLASRETRINELETNDSGPFASAIKKPQTKNIKDLKSDFDLAVKQSNYLNKKAKPQHAQNLLFGYRRDNLVNQSEVNNQTPP